MTFAVGNRNHTPGLLNGHFKQLQDETIILEKMATRGELSAEIGHELNNFLAVIAGRLSIVYEKAKQVDANDILRHLQSMDETIKMMNQFTSNLMDLTPISTKMEIVYFEKLIRKVIDYLRPQWRFDGINIHLQKNSDTFPVKADLTHLQQLLYNLFNNAADSTTGRSQRNIKVSISADSGKSNFTVVIEDNGCGMSHDQLENAFSKRFTSKEHGHGFGLMVCKRIIENHMGSLKVESTADIGTSIAITFPLAVIEEPTIA